MHSRHTSGLVGELKAATYFAENGYEIYWPALTQSTVDFVAIKNTDIKRVQVKNAYWMERPSGARYVQATIRKGSGGSKTYTELDCDLIVIVHEDSLWVFPVDIVTKYKTINLAKAQQIRKSRKGVLDIDKYKVNK